MPVSPLLDIQSISKTYGGRTVIADLSLSIEDGEFFSLLGPSGCGKSTLLRLIAGFDAPDRGKIFHAGRDLTYAPVRSRDLNMVFQHYALFPHMTVFDNVAFGLRMQKKSETQVREEVSTALNLVQMGDYGQRMPQQLSGGQQQRIALARAIAPHPAILLLDEPLGALDQRLRKDMQGELKQLQRRLGITFIFVTHDQDEAMSMSDRLAVMEHGTILQVGRPEEIYERPRSREVASFLGEVTFLEGKLESERGKALRLCSDHGFSWIVENPDDLGRASQAVAILRPEAWSIEPWSDPSEGSRKNLGFIEELHYKGRETLVKVRLSGGETILIAHESQPRLHLQQQVLVSPRTERVRVLPSGA